VLPGPYYNDGTKWIRMGGAEFSISNYQTRILEIPVNEVIGTQSVILSGESDAVVQGMYLQGIRPVFSDEDVAQMYFLVTNNVKFGTDGTKIKWRIRITNSNIDLNKNSTLTRIIITYESDLDYGRTLNSSKNVQVLVGQ
jgi:hypothetical protein